MNEDNSNREEVPIIVELVDFAKRPLTLVLSTALFFSGLAIFYSVKEPSHEEKAEAVWEHYQNTPREISYKNLSGKIMSTESPKEITREYSLNDLCSVPLLLRTRTTIKDKAPPGLGSDDIITSDEKVKSYDSLSLEKQLTVREDYRTLINSAYNKIPKKN